MWQNSLPNHCQSDEISVYQVSQTQKGKLKMENFKLIPIENKGERVLTTAQLAEYYETDGKVISDNFNNNIKRYTEGKHFYRLTGKELKAFKNYSENFGLVDKRASSLYLWTEKGALLHAKSLNTDKAWEVYDFLVENLSLIHI